MTNSQETDLRYKLISLGHIIPLDRYISFQEVKKTISTYQKHFKPYNPRKSGYNRYGLSLTSKDGDFSGVPDLDSLYEYNKLNDTEFDEPDFREWTPLFKSCKSLKSAMEPFHNCIGRSHILRLDKGGFFPPHRDLSQTSFRLFISLCESPQDYVFILDEKKVFFQPHQVYFINTLLSHSLFSFTDESLFVVFNIDLNEESIEAVFNNLSVY